MIIDETYLPAREMSAAIEGSVNFIATGELGQSKLYRRFRDGSNRIDLNIRGDAVFEGSVRAFNDTGAVTTASSLQASLLAEGAYTQFNAAARHEDNNINGAEGGTAGPANTATHNVPTFTVDHLDIAAPAGTAYKRVRLVRIWDDLLTDAQLATATS